jgi:CheY-like chemotaxis protein
MVVDDDLQVARSLARLFRRDYQVTIATSGAEALEKLDGFQPDIIISDFRMPGMNGAELINAVRSSVPGVAAVLLSGYADLEWGFDEEASRCRFVRKPWDDLALLALVKELLAPGARGQP